jgi:hypothetical protein
MADTYSILLAGLGASEESFISTHFSGLGHAIITARDFAGAQGQDERSEDHSPGYQEG